MDNKTNFIKLQEKVDKEEGIYENFRISAEDYNFPHIYLTDEEIIEFNEECKKAGIDLKVVPLSDYMNISSSKNDVCNNIKSNMELVENSFIENKGDEEEEKFFEDEKSQNNSINFDNKIENNKQYIGKKNRRKVISDEEEDKSNEKNSNTDKSYKSFKSSIEFNRHTLEDVMIDKNKNRNRS